MPDEEGEELLCAILELMGGKAGAEVELVIVVVVVGGMSSAADEGDS